MAQNEQPAVDKAEDAHATPVEDNTHTADDAQEHAPSPEPSVTSAPQAVEGVDEYPMEPSRQDWSGTMTIIIVGCVLAITVFVLMRWIGGRDTGGIAQLIRSKTEHETPLERVRQLERKKRVRQRDVDPMDAVRVQRRRSPVRPLRELERIHDIDQDQRPVLDRATALAKEIIPPEPVVEPQEVVLPQESTDSPDTESLTIEEDPIEAGPPAFSVDELRAFTSVKRGTTAHAVAPSPTSAISEAPLAKPDMAADVKSTAASVATTTRAARTLGQRAALHVDPPLTNIEDMDEFVAPLPIDIVLQLLEELLNYGQDLRRKKGYDAIVYVETDPTQTHFQRGHEGHIRIQHTLDAFAKPSLALDVMRRKGFPPQTKPVDAHLLSLVQLGRYLLGSASPDDVMLSMDELSVASARFSDEELRLLRYLLAPEEHTQLQTLVLEREGVTSGTLGVVRQALAPEPGEVLPVADVLPCPNCASDVEVGDLACRQCHVALHPKTVYCAACGTRNLIFADGRTQYCSHLNCDEQLLLSPTAASVQAQRLAVVSNLLSGFDEFQVLPVQGGTERYAALTHGRPVEVWLLSANRNAPLIEDDRPRYGLTEIITLPERYVEQGGVCFVVYDPPAQQGYALHQLGAEKLAESLLTLVEQVHRANLRMPSLVLEDLTVRESGDVCLMHGHVLQAATAATPQIDDVRCMAPELRRQAIATERSDLYTIAAIWTYAISGLLPEDAMISNESDAFIGTPDSVLEWMKDCLREVPADRPASASDVLAQLHGRRRLEDLI